MDILKRNTRYMRRDALLQRILLLEMENQTLKNKLATCQPPPSTIAPPPSTATPAKQPIVLTEPADTQPADTQPADPIESIDDESAQTMDDIRTAFEAYAARCKRRVQKSHNKVPFIKPAAKQPLPPPSTHLCRGDQQQHAR